LIFTVLLLAGALRFYDLGAGLWHDEILTCYKYVRAPIGVTLTTIEDANQHFLYTLLAQVSVSIFGETNQAVRLPAVLFGIASIWALYLLGREVRSEREALLSALLLAVSYHHVWFSQNARGYSGLLFWTLVTSWLLLRAIREQQRRLWLWYAATVALGMYTNLAMLFTVAGHFTLYVIAWIRRRAGASGLVAGFCFSGFLTLLLYSLVLPQLFGAVGGEVSTVPAWKQPLWAILEFMKAMEIGFAGKIAGAAALIVFVAGFVDFLRKRWEIPLLLALPVILCAAVTIALGHHIWPRLFFFAFGFGALIVTRGVMVCAGWLASLLKQPQRGPLLGTAGCLLMCIAASLALGRAYGPKQDFVGARSFVESQRQPGDAVAMVGLAPLTYRNFYVTDWTEVTTLDELNRLRASASRTWLVYTFPTHVRSVHPEILDAADREFELRRQFYGTVGDGTVYVKLSTQ
jgi:4-amino-4-deoxy-L-arabinose transferase-like glycosyltransferase